VLIPALVHSEGNPVSREAVCPEGFSYPPPADAIVRKRGEVRNMPISRVMSKGQVNIPSEVRKELGIEQGDDLVFEVGADQTARMPVVKRQKLSDFYGSLPAQRPFPGKEAVREEAGRALGGRAKRSGP
jgi:antitoxin PrlF